MTNIIVGLEIHAQLKTDSKVFCSCKNSYSDDPNTNLCPTCMGLPGSLPRLNEKVVDYAILAGLALNCTINGYSTFERKKYFYPDLSKGYQISQDTTPICQDGYIELDSKKKIRIERIHIEEDTGKSLIQDDGTRLLDYNRAGIPLIEIVTKPDISSPEEAREFLNILKNTLNYIEISDGKMEEGSLRCDVNINIEDKKTGDRTEIIELKNLNSFSAVAKSIEYESKRQYQFLNSQNKEIRSTRRWDDSSNGSVLMREKFTEDDYKYTSDLDVQNLNINTDRIQDVKSKMPELMDEKAKRFMDQYDLNEYDANVLASNRNISEYFDKIGAKAKNYQLLANFFINEFLRRIDQDNFDESSLNYSIEDFLNLLDLLDENKINNNTGKKVFRLMFEEGIDPALYVEENNLVQITDDSFIDSLVEEVLDENPESVSDYLGGKDRVLGFLVGQVMKKSQGKANPQIANEKLTKALSLRKN